MVGETIAGRYDVEDLVGHGGMSSVYRAHDRLLERHVALKILHDRYTVDEEFVERFKREARSVAQLSHPNIVTVIDRGEEDGRQYIVFEFVEGENLKELLVRSGRLSVTDALEVGAQVARALAFAHEQGLVHRDVKPQNVLLNGDGRVKVTDFGIARSIDVEGVTQAGTVLGTSDYIAPEQASGRPVEAQTDIYSLGIVLYELLAGEPPFSGDNFVAVALKHVNEIPRSLLEVRRDVPPRVANAIDRAIEKDPNRRFPSMDAFAAELEACLSELGHDAEDTQERIALVRGRQPGHRRKPVSRWAIGIALIGLLAIGAAVAGLLIVRRHDSTPPPTAAAVIQLRGLRGYDPYGDNHVEDDATAPLATDRNPSTYWSTEQYYDRRLNKPGVGLELAANKLVLPRGITVSTSTPGFMAQILAGNDVNGSDFHPVSGLLQINGTTTFPLHLHAPKHYFVVWITKLPPGSMVVQITEVKPS